MHIITGNVGSGKTTLSMALAGLLKPETGEIEYNEIGKIFLSMQFPEYHLTKLTVEEEIKSWGLLPDEILKISDLEGTAKFDPMKLSRGELKRLHLACILSKTTDLLILDEPFSTLDPVWKEKFCSHAKIQKKITIIFTHEQSVLPKADYIWEIENGRLNYLGKIPECLFKWKNAPIHVKTALSMGVTPDNIRFEDTREALCRMQD
ncbi:MAG: ATP-binding cassette domain-containing protein [Methanomicrobiaceae archaeon]|nr:ATP-binding cassette domain-containing protein [Methanomicrobiaceae archaeon]